MNEDVALRCLDLFCGAGGFSEGFKNAGYEIIAGIDNDEEALLTYRKNHEHSKGIKYDLSNINQSNINKHFKSIINEEIDVIIGGPPCQGLSVAGKRIADDPRNKLYQAYLSFIEHYDPKALVLENVPAIKSLYDGKIADAISSDFSDYGYNVQIDTLTASDYGVPQKRKRTFFIATKNKKFSFPKSTTPDNPITTYDAISDLPLLQFSSGANEMEYPRQPMNDYQKYMRNNSKKLYNHLAVNHRKRTKKIISMVPDGGNYKDLPPDLQDTRKVNIAWTRMDSKEPCFTIDAGHNHHFHYKANRVPTVRESARIQSFKDDFIFHGKKTSQFRQVGNAVPPLLSEIIAKKLKEVL